MNRRALTATLAAAFCLTLWLFTGVERIHREHTTDYKFFTKQSPGFRIVFENPAMCGECDLRPWELIRSEDRSRFAEYCAARFGLDDARTCYAIFETQQRIMTERLRPPETAR